MKIGKVPNNVLKDIILNKIKAKRPEVLVRPGIGEDCSAVDFGDNVCVLSSDPITGAVNEIGRLAVHVSCNDIASSGVEPIGLMVTILAPAGTTEKELETVMEQISGEASKINVDIIGGHTEITDAVNRFVVVITSIGKALKNRLVTTSGARPGDFVIMTKSAGIEGTAIIAHDREEVLKEKLGTELVENAKTFINSISVVKEGRIAGEFGVSSMHDATEGGILGAVWEIAEASGTGIRVYKNKIPVEQETQKIAGFFNIDPLRLISSGCMLITCKDGEGLLEKLKDNGINAEIIGEVVDDRLCILITDNGEEEITQPDADELYKVI